MLSSSAVPAMGERTARPGIAGGRPKGNWTPHRLARGHLGFERGVEEGSVFQHGAGDIEEAIGDRSEGAAMAVTPAAQRGVLGLACRIKLNSDTRPVVHDISKPVTAGLPSDDNAALAGLLGDGRDSGQTAQSGVVAPFKAIPSLCEQRGEDDPSHSRQGCKDFHVMLLLLPRLRFLCWDEPGRQGIQPAMSLFDLPVKKE